MKPRTLKIYFVVGMMSLSMLLGLLYDSQFYRELIPSRLIGGGLIAIFIAGVAVFVTSEMRKRFIDKSQPN